MKSQVTNHLGIGIWCLVLGIFIVAVVPVPAYGFSLVNCGRTDQIGTADEQCNLGHLITLIMRLINYLISVAAVVAMYQILVQGFDMIIALGNAEKIQHAKEGLSQAVIGFAIIVLAFVFVNLLINGIFGDGGNVRKWWDPNCIYNITNTTINSQCPKLRIDKLRQPERGPGRPDDPAASCTDKPALARAHNNAKYPTGNSPALQALIDCVRSSIGGKIDQGQIYTFERQTEICNYTRADGHCGVTCQHSANSCHYGGPNGTQGAEAVDFNAKQGVSEQELYTALQGLGQTCNFGNIIFENDHTHVSTPACRGDRGDSR